MDSNPSKANHSQENPGQPWSCIPSRSGLFVHNVQGSGCFLPASQREEETVLAQPPLAVTLSIDEVRDLMRAERPYATTRYGPEVQEKASNQDFALSALIEDGGGDRWCFGAVADGVSTATFWPERAARLACLASYRFFRETFVDRSEVDLGDRALLDLKRGLVTALRTSLEADRRRLRSHRSLVPPTFTQREYLRRWDSDELWYKTTLLVGLMGPAHGFVLWSGDGGIWLRRQGGAGPAVKRVLGSADGPLQNYVWLGVQEKDLSVGRIPLEDREAATLALASDGLDRTLQLNETGYEELLPSGAIGPRYRRLEGRLDELYRAESWRSGTQPEPDNASLVVLEWVRGRRFAGEIAQPERFVLAEVQAPPAADPPLKEPEPMGRRRPPERAQLPAAAGQPQKTLRRPATGPSPSQAPQRREYDDASSGSRTLPRVATISIAVFVVVGLLAWLGLSRSPSIDSSEADKAGGKSQGDSSSASTDARASPTASAPAESPTESSADSHSPAQGPAQESTSASIPAEPLEFTVLEPGGLLLEAIGPPPQESAEALVGELAEWSKQARALSNFEESPAVTVVAYGDRNKPTLDGCLANERVARDRAKLFAELLQLFTTEVTVHAAWNACEAPPGISNPASAEARRLVLFRGHYVVHCDCEGVSWAKS